MVSLWGNVGNVNFKKAPSWAVPLPAGPRDAYQGRLCGFEDHSESC